MRAGEAIVTYAGLGGTTPGARRRYLKRQFRRSTGTPTSCAASRPCSIPTVSNPGKILPPEE